jgi:flagellar hook-length control protein FliK
MLRQNAAETPAAVDASVRSVMASQSAAPAVPRAMPLVARGEAPATAAPGVPGAAFAAAGVAAHETAAAEREPAATGEPGIADAAEPEAPWWLGGPGGAALLHPTAPGAPLQVLPRVGSSDWGAAVGQQLARLAPGSRDVELNLNPVELGPLKVTLSLSDGQAQVVFASDNAAVRQALEAALPQLRSSFADNGISLGQASVGSGSGDPRPEHGSAGQPRSAETASDADGAAAPGETRPAPPAQPRGAGTGLHTFA